MRVLVRVLKSDDKTSSGLYLPPGAKEKHDEALYGEVIEVARARGKESDEDIDLGTNISGVPCGVRILFSKEAGVRVPWDESLRLLDTKEVLATVEEIPIDAAH